MGEPLQVNHQIVGGRVDLHLFGCVDVLLALAAVPLVIAFQQLFLSEKFKTVLQVDIARGAQLEV